MSTTESPFRNVPYDVLREIFLQYLPEDRLDEPQPSPKIAPMLLCHVCASWRAIALSNASLWTHLHIRLPIRWNTRMNPKVRDSAALKRDIEFMKWWKMNHSSMALFFRLNVHRKSWRDSKCKAQETNLDSEATEFLLDYMSSAHYLDIGQFYAYLTQEGTRRGMRIISLKLHTLVSHDVRFADEGDIDDEDEYPHPKLALPPPSQTPPTLRRLSLSTVTQMMEDKDLVNWSTLTHLDLNCFYVSIDDWFTILSALKDLQWANLDVSIDDNTMNGPPPNISLPSLATLTVFLNEDPNRSTYYPFTVLFRNVHLPALRTLSLSSWLNTWSTSEAATEISNVLKSAPGVTKLALGSGKKGFLYFGDDSGIPTGIDHRGPPLMWDAPNLAHLHVELPVKNEHDAALLANNFITELFLSTCWLDLAHPDSTIQTVTIVIKMECDVNAGFEKNLKALLLWNIDQHIKTTSNNVRFEIASEAEQGMFLSERVWRTWGSGV
ncbi:hypothetical protein BJ912DRAFT_1006821 [Pholiota molesta]|nr:hypothetical protein BJ912DRAFT_1006821 [Pholiota molesta]